MSRLEGKAALVTGASRGIGRGIATRLAADGALVAVHYGQRREDADETVRSIEVAGGRAFAIGADVTRPEAITALFKRLPIELNARGHDALDILVNNAGAGGGGSIAAMTVDDFDRLFATNVKGPFLITQQALPWLRDGGRVINISSMVSLAAYPNSIAYAMTKKATAFYAKAAALGRIGQPADISGVVAFLASDDGGWITGQVLQASGGMHL